MTSQITQRKESLLAELMALENEEKRIQMEEDLELIKDINKERLEIANTESEIQQIQIYHNETKEKYLQKLIKASNTSQISWAHQGVLDIIKRLGGRTSSYDPNDNGEMWEVQILFLGKHYYFTEWISSSSTCTNTFKPDNLSPTQTEQEALRAFDIEWIPRKRKTYKEYW